MNIKKIMVTVVFGAVLILVVLGKITITLGASITDKSLESFFRKHKIDGNYPVALKKRSVAISYLATIHGYPDNMSVCDLPPKKWTK